MVKGGLYAANGQIEHPLTHARFKSGAPLPCGLTATTSCRAAPGCLVSRLLPSEKPGLSLVLPAPEYNDGYLSSHTVKWLDGRRNGGLA